MTLLDAGLFSFMKRGLGLAPEVLAARALFLAIVVSGLVCLTRLAARLSVPVELYDERFTTRLAERSGGRASEDSRAAAHLLDSWLAARHSEAARG